MHWLNETDDAMLIYFFFSLINKKTVASKMVDLSFCLSADFY